MDTTALGSALGRLARSHVWTWSWELRSIFDELADDPWTHPVEVVAGLSVEQLEGVLADTTLFGRIQAQTDALDQLEATAPAQPDIAYFSPEFGISELVPQYSGGLGILAGDHVKAASDLALPLCGVGLFYRQGFFQQDLSRGRQIERYEDHEPAALGAEDTGLVVTVPIASRQVHARAWKLTVGRVTIILLDTDVAANAPEDRAITDRLYGGDRRHRIEQELVLGVGGARALGALGWAPDIHHLNEGHAGFLLLELLDREIGAGATLAEARERVRPHVVFTTHTPVPAGIDRFDAGLAALHLQPWADAWNLPVGELVALGADPDDRDGQFNMAIFCLESAARSNGVSKLHGAVSRDLFAQVRSGRAIGSITNGVHARSWTAPHLQVALDETCGPGWADGDPDAWHRIDRLSDDTVRELRRAGSKVLTDFVVERTGFELDPDVLTIGFARRFATYKRADLLLQHHETLEALLADDDRPIQFVFAGKAHPADKEGKELLARIVAFAKSKAANGRFVFIPDYEMAVARAMYAGCDVWLNTPIRPHEACGTSGEKAALNGGLNCSISDGWWDEMADDRNGWTIPDSLASRPSRRDREESAVALEIIASEIVPAYYGDGVPLSPPWLSRVRHCWRSLGPRVTAARMVRDYRDQLYEPPLAPSVTTSGDDETAMRIWPGSSTPLGATWDGSGVNVAVYSELAERVELCLFDDQGNETRTVLPSVTSSVHNGYVPDMRPGQRYGFRVHGPWTPREGARCNPAKLLLDPYARAIEGELDWHPSVFGYDPTDHDRADERDSAAHVPRSIVVDGAFDWGDDTPPRTELHNTMIYETHVRGISARHPDVPPELRGTYAGLASEPIVDYLVSLGITAVELLPIHQSVSEHALVERGLSNYWGYNSIGYFAPHGPYSAAGDGGQQVVEFKQMVKRLHQADIEVILDVVYNHTAEGNRLGPHLSFKGFDNPAYYRLDPHDRRYYVDYTGTGNSLNMRHSESLKLMMDSLRYWVQEMHVDGFRFDLASTLARGLHEVDRLSSFFDTIHQDPVVNQVKLIAEPWDVGEGGYQVGNFPPLWSEWNGRYRDGVRDYWRGADETLGDLASRLTGSSDLYAWSGRKPSASINFITAHDGFTLADLVSYDHKHNEANGEADGDGESHNRSWNSGVEGPTDDPEILDVRNVRRRSMLATLFLSQGVPMLSGGDEIGRTQHGNNNAYAQDNEISWYDWENVDQKLLEYVRRLVRIRTNHPTFRRRRWFQGRPLRGESIQDVGWFTPDGEEMTEEDWSTGYARSLALFLNGEAITARGPRGERITDASFLLLLNANPEPVTFRIPMGLGGRRWRVHLDTATAHARDAIVATNAIWDVGAWALMLLQLESEA